MDLQNKIFVFKNNKHVNYLIDNEKETFLMFIKHISTGKYLPGLRLLYGAQTFADFENEIKTDKFSPYFMNIKNCIESIKEINLHHFVFWFAILHGDTQHDCNNSIRYKISDFKEPSLHEMKFLHRAPPYHKNIHKTIVPATRAEIFSETQLLNIFTLLLQLYCFVIPIDDYKLSDRTVKCLKENNINTLGQLALKKESEVKAIKNLSQSSFNELDALLAENKLSFGFSFYDELFYIIIQSFLKTPIDDYKLSDRTVNCLKENNINTLGQLAIKEESEVKEIKNLSQSSFNELEALLAENKLSFGFKVREHFT